MRKVIEFYDDERSIGNSIIITLKKGWSFCLGRHEGVKGFDTPTEAREATAKENLYRCSCEDCTSK